MRRIFASSLIVLLASGNFAFGQQAVAPAPAAAQPAPSTCPVIIDTAYPVSMQPGRWFIKFNSQSDKEVVAIKFEMHYMDKTRDEQPTMEVQSISDHLKPRKTFRYNFIDNSPYADAPGGFRIHFLKVLFADDSIWAAPDASCDGKWVKERGNFVRR